MKTNNNEIELRGKIISLSLPVEDAITQLIYNSFYPKNTETETREIYFNEFIMPNTFSKKISIYRKIYKTSRYKNVLNQYLIEKKIIGKNKKCEFKNYDDYINHLLNLLSEIIYERNIIAHGKNMSGAFSTLENDELVLGNKSNLYVFSRKFLDEYSTKTLKAYLMLTMVDIER